MPRPPRALPASTAAALLLAGAGALAAGTNRFTRVGGPDGGLVTDLALAPGAPAAPGTPAAPGRLWAVTSSSGLFASTDGAASWAAVVGTIDDHAGSGLADDPSWAQEPIAAVAVDPSQPGVFYAATETNLWKTANGGASWTPAGLGGGIGSLAVSPSAPANVYAAAGPVLWRSRNAGVTWQTVASRRSFFFSCLTVDPEDPEVLYGGAAEQGVLRSPDGGVHWRPFLPESVIADSTVVRLRIDATVAPRRLYAGTGDGLYLSRDGGTTWSAATSGPAPGTGGVTALTLDPAAPGTVYAAATLLDEFGQPAGATLWKSTDAGASWTALPFLGVMQALVIDPEVAGHLYAGTLDDGIQESRDGGASWTAASRGLAATYLTSMLADPLVPDTLYAAAEGGSHGLGVFRSTDRGATWTAANDGLGAPPPTVESIVADPRNAGTLYLPTFGQGLFKTTDGAATWQAIDRGLPMDLVRDFAVDPSDPQKLYAVGFQRLPSPQLLANAAARSTDGGATWARIDGIPADDYLAAVAVDPRHPETVYAGETSLFRSDDHGASWTPLASPDGEALAQLIPDPATGTLYALTENNGVFKSLDRGATWIVKSQLDDFNEVGAFRLALVPGEPNALYTAGYHGVLLSTDGGAGYIELDPAFTGVMRALTVEPRLLGTVYTAPYSGGGVFAFTPGPADCATGPTAVCLTGRFAVSALWHDFQGGSGQSAARPLSAVAGAFRLLGPDDELVVKILDARVFGLDYLVIWNSLGEDYSLRIEDTETGRLRGYSVSGPEGRIDIFPSQPSAASPARSPLATAEPAPVLRSTAASPCVASDTTLCFFAGRFRAEVAWKTPDGQSGAGHPFPFHLTDGGGFWFFSADNPELMLQIQDLRPSTGHFWFSYAGLSTVEYTLTVTDTVSGTQKAYLHRAGGLDNATDTGTF